MTDALPAGCRWSKEAEELLVRRGCCELRPWDASGGAGYGCTEARWSGDCVVGWE
jgi:hypothetical protein